ncbi:Uncharacterised protein [Edwardsiella tarda]|nr:Uncharacterised protein [Edwardsiella tarda]
MHDLRDYKPLSAWQITDYRAGSSTGVGVSPESGYQQRYAIL